MKKTILLALMALVLVGCDGKEKKDFIQKYGATSRYYCDDTGFLIREYVFNSDTFRDLVLNDAKVPTRCSNNVEVKVKETVATGALSGSVK